MFWFMEHVFPLIVIFLLFRGILQTILGKGQRRRREPMPEDLPEEEEPVEMEPQEPPKQSKEEDWAAEFDRRLQKTTEASETKRARDRVYTDRETYDSGRDKVRRDVETYDAARDKVRRDTQTYDVARDRVHRDDEKHHDTKGRIHYDNEGLQHDKGRVYKDPYGDYSYNEAEFNRQVAASRLHPTAAATGSSKVKLKHAALVQGFIMSQVLAKPRALDPYDGEIK
ncbi:hypothetical protein [Phascolarctobacterium sp.]|uniref:hypothetical protein n=1 Tax=Phascolarctobacterium sp. TaxID=2049039 RepID=UPI00386AA880